MNEQQEEQTKQTEDESSPVVVEEMENEQPEESKIFGIPSFCFRGAAFGVAFGYILSGVIGLVFHRDVSANVCAIIGAAAGYFIAKTIRKKRQTQQETKE